MFALRPPSSFAPTKIVFRRAIHRPTAIKTRSPILLVNMSTAPTSTSQRQPHPSFRIVAAADLAKKSPKPAAPREILQALKSDPKSLSLFLSGQISPRCDSTPQTWQSSLANALSHLPLTVFNPHRPDWDSSWKSDPDFPPLNEQVNWELDAIEGSDLVVVSFAPGSDAPVTLMEFGLAVGRDPKKVICWLGEGYSKSVNVVLLCRRLGLTILRTEGEVVDELTRRVTNAQ